MSHRLLFISCSLAALALSSAAFAQPQTANWTGPYAGVTLGAAWGSPDVHILATGGGGEVVIPPADITTIDETDFGGSNNVGFAGAFEAGYNYQVDHVLLGLEGEFGYLGANRTRVRTFTSGLLIEPPVTYTLADKVSTDWMWSVRPRLGYAEGPWLSYVTGGVAGAQGRLSTEYFDTHVPPNVVFASGSSMRVGWIVGVGGAYAFTPNWSGKLEYLYSNFGDVNVGAVAANGFVAIHSQVGLHTNIVRAGLDYKF